MVRLLLREALLIKDEEADRTTRERLVCSSMDAGTHMERGHAWDWPGAAELAGAGGSPTTTVDGGYEVVLYASW